MLMASSSQDDYVNQDSMPTSSTDQFDETSGGSGQQQHTSFVMHPVSSHRSPVYESADSLGREGVSADSASSGFTTEVVVSSGRSPAASHSEIFVPAHHDVGQLSSRQHEVELVTPSGMMQTVGVVVTESGQATTADGPYCLICGDKGSGYHYSVYSCEGCKGFFKRSVQKNLGYACKENKNCIINKYTRNSCQFCRFHKCMEAGMKKEAVREDRTPGGKHRHKRPKTGDHEKGQAPVRQIDMSNVASPTPSMTTVILQQEPYDDHLLQKLVEANPSIVPVSDDEIPDVCQLDINDLMQYGYIELRYIIEWARKVPGFSELLIEDQMALLKASFMELNVLRLSHRSMCYDGSVMVAEGMLLSPKQAVNIGWGMDLINCTLEFIDRLRDIEMDSTEFCILNAIILTYPDAAGVQEKSTVTSLQSRILDCLRKYTISKYPHQPRRYGKMLLRLPALRTVSAKAAERFLSMSLDGSVKMNALVLEIMS